MLMTLNSSGHSIQKILFLAGIQNNFGHNTLSVESLTDTQREENNLNFVKILQLRYTFYIFEDDINLPSEFLLRLN